MDFITLQGGEDHKDTMDTKIFFFFVSFVVIMNKTTMDTKILKEGL